MSKIANFWYQVTQKNWQFYGGIVFLLIVIGGLIYGGWRVSLIINDTEASPIEAIAINGERQYTTDNEIKAVLKSLMNNSFFNADIDQVRKAVENLPWVYRATVRREWPATLKVFLQEQVPIARWNDDQWLNEHGEPFTAPMQVGLEDAVQLKGPDDSILEIIETYKNTKALLNANDFKLEILSLSPRHAWEVTLGNGVILKLGIEDRMTRIKRFIELYPEIQAQGRNVATVDLRYDTGLAVGWKDEPEESH